MSNPIIFDTGALIALFNKKEEAIASKIENHIALRPHSPRLVYECNLIELFYKLVRKEKRMTPKDIKTNFDHFAIEIFPVPNEISVAINRNYLSLDYKSVFDYADFYMCSAALRFDYSEILTVDRDDLPIALSQAMKFFSVTQEKIAQLIPFKKD